MKKLSWDEYQAAIAVLLQLREAFPEVIARLDLWQRRPLKIGIRGDIQALLPEIDPAVIVNAMQLYCSDRRYLNCMVEGAERVDLDGVVTGTVTAEGAVGARKGFEGILRREEARRAGKGISKKNVQNVVRPAQTAAGEVQMKAAKLHEPDRGEFDNKKNQAGRLGLSGLRAAARARSAPTASST